MVFIGILVGLIILVLLVVVHELGHAIVARRNGVVVEEFGIGFPPAAKKWRPKKSFLGKNVVFSLNWLPLGGFVKLKGEYDSAEGAGTYGGATFWVKTKILLAGVMMNWLTAALLFMILALVGMPKILPQQAVLPFDSRVERSALTVARVTAVRCLPSGFGYRLLSKQKMAAISVSARNRRRRFTVLGRRQSQQW